MDFPGCRHRLLQLSIYPDVLWLRAYLLLGIAREHLSSGGGGGGGGSSGGFGNFILF